LYGLALGFAFRALASDRERGTGVQNLLLGYLMRRCTPILKRMSMNYCERWRALFTCKVALSLALVAFSEHGRTEGWLRDLDSHCEQNLLNSLENPCVWSSMYPRFVPRKCLDDV